MFHAGGAAGVGGLCRFGVGVMDGSNKVVFGVDWARQAGHQPARGLVSGTWVETASGWAPVDTVQAGAVLHVHGGGLRPVLDLQPRPLAAGAMLVHVPGGALDNCADLWLAEGQLVLIDTMGDPDLPDALEVLVPATALVGRRDITLRTASDGLSLWRMQFEDEEVVWAQSGVALHAPSQSRPDSDRQSVDFAQLAPADAQQFVARRLG